MSWRSCLTVLVLLIMPIPVVAAPIFVQTPPTNTGTRSDVDTLWEAADDFSLAAAETVTSVSWRGMYYAVGTPQAVDDFVINFYSDAPGEPNLLLQSFSVGNAVDRTATGLFPFGGVEFFDYTADLGAGLALAASTTYWMSIVNDTTADGDDNWHWAVEFNAGNSSVSEDGGSSWYLEAQEHYFILDDGNPSTPEPATLLLLGAGVAAAASRRMPRSVLRASDEI